MAEPTVLTAIEARIVNDHLVIPHGMTPIYLHSINGQMIAHVEGWTEASEYDQNWYDLYRLDNARNFIMSITSNGEQTNQDWYGSFGEPTKEAMKDTRGELVIRERPG